MKRHSSGAPRRYAFSPEVSFTLKGTTVVATLRQAQFSFSTAFYQALLAFAEPHTIREVHRALGGGVSERAFTRAVEPLVRGGFLVGPDLSVRVRPLETYLNKKVWEAPGFQARLSKHLRAGRACIIRDAFQPAFARRVAGELERTAVWEPREDFRAFFGYRVHGLDTRDVFTPGMLELDDVFGSQRTKAMVEKWCGSDCGGAVEMTAHVHFPGDYALPHRDRGRARTLAFLWYLTRDWDSSWGGQFFWCPTGQFLMPTFNTLLMFKTSTTAQHVVCPVAPTAMARRIAVNGFWTSDRKSEVSDTEERQRRKGDWSYGKPLKPFARNGFIIG